MAGAASQRLWLLSNGHAEDLLGAALLERVLARVPGWSAAVVPLVGEGRAYEGLASRGQVSILGPRRRLPADGLTMHHPALLWRDLRAGLIGVTWAQAMALRGGRGAAALVVGDVYPQTLARLLRVPRRFVVQPLVSVRMAEGGGRVAWNRVFMERIRRPELLLLRAAEAVYPRDEPTAAWLRARGVPARFLGNPIMDGLEGTRLRPWPDLPTLALLPGSRGYAVVAAERMLAALSLLADEGAPLVAAVAWAFEAMPDRPGGWEVEEGPSWPVWRRGALRLAWVRHRFADVLRTADAVLGTTGTAQEQAAGLGLPVVSFAVPPHLSPAFLANQARLLGPALEVAAGTPVAVAAAVRRALWDVGRRESAVREGPARLGGPGGTEAIAADLAARLANRGRG